MKRIILSDRGALFVDTILQNTDWEIALLVLDDFGHHREKYENVSRIKKIVTLSEIMDNLETIDYDLDDLKTYLQLFHIADYGARRVKDDIYFSHYQFYSAYGYWKSLIKNNKIDACIITNTIHGFASDYILEEMMKKEKIPCYNIYYHFFDKYGVYKINDDSLLINHSEKSEIIIQQIASYASRYNYNSGIDGIPYSHVLSFIYKLFGSYGVRLASFLVRGKYPIHYHESDFISYWRTIKHIKKMQKYVNKLYEPYNKEIPFLVYFLHFEPEAVLTGNADVIDSQLFYIRMLAQALPEGYCLYVKEHPDLYKINMWEMEYHIPCMETFYTKYFYDQIKKIKNVKLINYHISASELIKNSKAVSTIAGTVLSEAVIEKKPIIIFSGKKHIYTYDQNVFSPISAIEVKECVKKISEGYEPDYSLIPKLIEKYLFDRNERGECEVIREIKKNLNG